jgi:hypothetical protein
MRGQDHHVAKRWHDDLTTVPLCLACHHVATALQRNWPRELPSACYLELGASDLVRMAGHFGRSAVVCGELPGIINRLEV